MSTNCTYVSALVLQRKRSLRLGTLSIWRRFATSSGALLLGGVLSCGNTSSGVGTSTSGSESQATNSMPAITHGDFAGASETHSTGATASDNTNRDSNSAAVTNGHSSGAVSSASSPSSTDTASSEEPSSSATETTTSVADTSLGEETESGGSSDASTQTQDAGVTQPNAPLTALTVFLAGDSTVSRYTDTASESDQAGWGQMLHEYLDPLATVDNRAIGGRTARRFIDDGALADIGEELDPGDVLMVQFGTNDGNRTATYQFNGQDVPYYLEPDTDFKTYLNEYIDLALGDGATPILVTPPPRNSAYCTGGNGTGAHAEAMRELGAERGVTVVDLNARSVAYLQAICPAPEPEDFFLLRSDGSVDGTHFQEHGARVLAGLVADEVSQRTTRLADFVLQP